jgi:hypothetical protein
MKQLAPRHVIMAQKGKQAYLERLSGICDAFSAATVMRPNNLKGRDTYWC